MLRGQDYRQKRDCEAWEEGPLPTVTYPGFVTGVLALLVIAGEYVISLPSSALLQRQTNRNLSPFSRLALHGNGPPVLLYDLQSEGQAETGPVDF